MEDAPQDSETLIQEALRSVRLPPRAVRKLLEVSQQPDVEMQRITDIITSDETLTARVLRLVNSALFGLSRPVSNIRQAVVMLGKASIIQLAIGVAAMTLEASTVDDTSFNREDFWRHSMAVAYLARDLGTQHADVVPEEAFTAGLLHDLGKLVLLSYLGERYTHIITTARHQQCPLHVAERDALDTDHGTITRKLCEKWKLPSSLLNGVSIHETEPSQNGLQAVVCVANAAAKSAGVGDSGNRYLSLSHLEADLLHAVARRPAFVRQLPTEVSRIERAFRFDADSSSSADLDADQTAPSRRILVQFDDDLLGDVVTIVGSALGFEPVCLRPGQSPDLSDMDGAAGWIVEAPPEASAPEGAPLVDAGTWLAQHDSAAGVLDVVAFRKWLGEKLG